MWIWKHEIGRKHGVDRECLSSFLNQCQVWSFTLDQYMSIKKRTTISDLNFSVQSVRTSVSLQKILCLKCVRLISSFLCDFTDTIWKNVFFQNWSCSKFSRIVLTKVIIITINNDFFTITTTLLDVTKYTYRCSK